MSRWRPPRPKSSPYITPEGFQCLEQETEVLYRIVGGDEFERDKRYISVDSPLAQQLLKKTFDDSVTIRTVAHTLTYSVLDIQYGLEFIED